MNVECTFRKSAMDQLVAKYFSRAFAHEKLGNGNKRVIARVSGDVLEIYTNEVTVDANGTARTSNTYSPFYKVNRFYITISTGKTDEPKFNCIVHRLDDVKQVRQLRLPETVTEVVEMRFSANARKLVVVCNVGQHISIYQYDTFNGDGGIVKETVVQTGDNYRLALNVQCAI
jgi:hypothetical protein